MTVPNTFANATTAIPLVQLDQNFNTGVTLGNTTVFLGNTTTSFGNVTLTNATVSSGTVGGSTAINTSGTLAAGNTTITGTLSASAKLTLSGVTNEAMKLTASASGTNGAANYINWYRADGTTSKGYIGYATADTTTLTISNDLGGPVSLSLSGTAIGTVSSTGFYVGTVNSDPTFNRVNTTFITTSGNLYSRGGGWDLGLSATSGTHIAFYTDNGARVSAGTIASSGSVTAYNTTSDRRLKQNIEPLKNALEKVLQLKPSTYNFIEGNQYSVGFIADELQLVVPEAVTGKANEVDEKENPVYQGVDASFLIPHLVSAIQELTARIAALESK